MLIVGGMIAFCLAALAMKPDPVGQSAPAQIQERTAPPSSAPAGPPQSNFWQSGSQPSRAPAGERTPSLFPETPSNVAPARDLYLGTPSNQAAVNPGPNAIVPKPIKTISIKSANPMTFFTDVPPAGVGLLLSSAQIAWCLAEEISIEAARPYVNTNAQSDLDRINSRIGNYDSRCAQSTYRPDDLAKARRIVEARRSQLENWAKRGQ
jgi:hypothetical protein